MVCAFYIVYICKQRGFEVVVFVIKVTIEICFGQLLFQAGVRIVPHIRPWPFPSMSLAVHYSLTIAAESLIVSTGVHPLQILTNSVDRLKNYNFQYCWCNIYKYVIYLNLKHLCYVNVGIDSKIIINIFLTEMILKLRLWKIWRESFIFSVWDLICRQTACSQALLYSIAWATSTVCVSCCCTI
jgi:hypothetical protein